MATQGLYLHWEGKRVYRQRVPAPRLLEPDVTLSYGEGSANMIIEGDNFQVLASLRSQYVEQVDVIYIDPPYNMGKNDFRYSDRRFHDPNADNSDAVYVTNEDGGQHTKWLNFMAPRLVMLQEMLSDRGVIFVSINDVELFRLGMLMNEVFGESNFVGTLVWRGQTDNNPSRIAIEHEYILCYAKHKERLPGRWSNPDDQAKQLMLETFQQLKAEGGTLLETERKFKAFVKDHKGQLGDLARYALLDEHGPYVARRNLDNPGKQGYAYDIIHPVTKKPCLKPRLGWRFAEERMQELIAEGRIVFGKDEHKIPALKVYLEEVSFPLRSVVEIFSGAASNELEALFGSRDNFRNPKPVDLVAMLLSYTTTRNSLVLDAFAGSGTTGHAVLRLNQRDNGQRRFILIEEGNGKDKFCRTLTAERVRRAIQKHDYQAGFTFYRTGRKIDRAAIIGLERNALANLICQTDETGRGKGIERLYGHQYVIGKNQRNEAICVTWNGYQDSEVTPDYLREALREALAMDLKEPIRVYGTSCRLSNTPYYHFYQIPDEIMVQMHIYEEDERDDHAT